VAGGSVIVNRMKAENKSLFIASSSMVSSHMAVFPMRSPRLGSTKLCRTQIWVGLSALTLTSDVSQFCNTFFHRLRLVLLSSGFAVGEEVGQEAPGSVYQKLSTARQETSAVHLVAPFREGSPVGDVADRAVA